MNSDRVSTDDNFFVYDGMCDMKTWQITLKMNPYIKGCKTCVMTKNLNAVPFHELAYFTKEN